MQQRESIKTFRYRKTTGLEMNGVKKIKLNYMIILIIGFTTLLLINAMGIFAYRDAVLSVETKKDTLLNFNLKYTSLFNKMRKDAKLYIDTGDEVYKTDFFLAKDEYLKSNIIQLKFQTDIMVSNKEGDISTNEMTLAEQVRYLGFTTAETKTYTDFKNIFNTQLDQMTAAINEKNMNLLNRSESDKDYVLQMILMDRLSQSYIERMNQSEDQITQRQSILEVTLILLSLALICLGSLTVVALTRENRHYSYFSQLYNTVVENVNVGICIMDKDNKYVYMNSMYREIMEINDDYYGRSVDQLFSRNTATIIESTINQKKNGSGKVNLYLGKQHKHLTYDYFTIYDEDNSSKSVHLIQDFTELENMQAQLINQLKEIEFYSQAKDTFIANFSHEIKTPINAILGMVHFLKNTDLSESQRGLVNKIETSSDILITIISDVLDLSKIKNQSLNLYPTNFSLLEAIKNVGDMFSSQMAGKGLEWITDYGFDPSLCVHLDKTRFVQVLVNLINNAFKFTDKGHVKLCVRTTFETAEYVELEFYVEDTGIGIAKNDISKLFHEFEQLENHLTKQHQGTGLGLFICKNIIESMEGRIWVVSTKGAGSRFYFSLPAKKAFYPESIANPSNFSGDECLDGHGSKVLVVEDTEINTEVAVKLLNDVNICCDTAMDGLEAVNLCRDKAPDYYKAILMDIHMPNMDGYTAAKVLKNEIGITSPIIALTASDINDEIREEHKDSIAEFILKPFKASAFYRTLAPYLKNGDEDPLAGREEAIKNLGGMETIYTKHINKFKLNYAQSAQKIKELIDESNYAEARRLAHSIKGLGGTLGMQSVQRTAADLEQAILKGEGYDTTPELTAFEKALKAAIAAI